MNNKAENQTDISKQALGKILKRLKVIGSNELLAEKMGYSKKYLSDAKGPRASSVTEEVRIGLRDSFGVDPLYFEDPANNRMFLRPNHPFVSFLAPIKKIPPPTTAGKVEDTSPTMGEIYKGIDIFSKEGFDDLLEHYPTEEIPQIPQDYRHVDIVNAINLLIAIENKRREKNKNDKDS